MIFQKATGTGKAHWPSNQFGAPTTWLVGLLLLFLLNGCIIQPLPPGDVDTLPAGEAGAVPVIAVAPAAVQAGDFVSVAGSGWQPQEIVFISIESIQSGTPITTTVSVVTVADDGSFTASFFLPDEAAVSDTGGLVLVAASSVSEDQVTEELTLLTAPATATGVAPATATPGATTATATPRPPTPVPTPSTWAEVTSRGLNLRSGPGAGYAIIRALEQGDRLTVLGQSRDSYWLYVQPDDGTLGWVARPYTNFTGSAPIVTQPEPTYVPTPIRTPGYTPTRVPDTAGWRGDYFSNRNLTGSPVFWRNDANIDFDWGYGSPSPSLRSDNFSVRWTRSLYLDGGTYRFYAYSDDGVRVWLDGELIIDRWREQGATTVTADRTVSTGYHSFRVEYFEGSQLARIRFTWERISDYPDWRAEYFTNRNLSGAPVLVRNDGNIDFDWGFGSPAGGIPADDFSVRWTRGVYFDAGDYRFRAQVDDGVRVWVDDRLIIDAWSDGSVRERTGDIYLGAGTHYLRVEYYDHTGAARIRITWERVSGQPDDFPDWKGEYWDNRSLSGSPDVVRNDEEIDFNWGTGSPDSRISGDDFSARWTREVDFRRGLYRFYARSDDGIRAWVDDDRIIDEWHDNDFDNTYTADLFLDDDHDLRVEYFEHNGGARVRFWWERISDATPTPVRPPNPSADVNPTSGTAGTRIIVTGSGFPANTPIYVYLGATVRASVADQAQPTRYASGVTDSRGFYNLAFVMPSTWPDGSPIEPGQLVVVVATDNFTVEASAFFNFQAPRPTVAPAPYLNVNPEQGGPNTPVTINGGGFLPNRRVNVHLGRVAAAELSQSNPRSYASATTDGNGNFQMSFTIPREWPNGDDIETGKLVVLVAHDDFSKQASAIFDYFVVGPNPSIQIAPQTGTAGTQVLVSGGGFPADTRVNTHLSVFGGQIGDAYSAARFVSTVTDGNGNYSMSFAMPGTWPDGSPVTQAQIVVTVANEDFTIDVSAVFNYVPLPTPTNPPGPTPTPTATATPIVLNPSVNLAPSVGTAGTSVTVSGGGFPANLAVNVHLAAFDGEVNESGAAERYANSVTDANGNYATSFVMPSRWPNGDSIETGRLVVIVATNDFNITASALFDFRSTAASEVEPSPTPVPTDTPIPTDTSTPLSTSTPAPPPTETPTPEPSPTPTDTLAPPTDTPTPEPPTATPEPPTPTATDTLVPEPPTATPTDTAIPPPAAPITGTNPVTGATYLN